MNELNYDLENIDKRLRVNVTIESVIRTIGRCVGLKINYPKGSSDLFVTSMEECHHGDTLLYVKDVKDNMQEIVCEASEPTCMNRQCYVEFLD